MSGHIPNSFQTPNLFIDRAMEHLTDSEFRVLMFATRHIYGWQDKAAKNLAYISLKMFEGGFTTKDGQRYCGCGLSRGAIIKAVQSLIDYGLLAREGKPAEKGQAYKIGEVIDWNKLEQRTAKRRDDYQKKTVKATETRQGVTSDVPVTSHDTTPVTSDVTMQGNVARTESNPSSNPSSNPVAAGACRQRQADPQFDLIAKVWNTTAGGYISNLQGMIFGSKVVKGEWAKCRFTPPATIEELTAFEAYAKDRMPKDSQEAMPTAAVTIQRYFCDFRAARDKKPAPRPAADIIPDTPPATPEERAALLKEMANTRPEWEKDKTA